MFEPNFHVQRRHPPQRTVGNTMPGMFVDGPGNRRGLPWHDARLAGYHGVKAITLRTLLGLGTRYSSPAAAQDQGVTIRHRARRPDATSKLLSNLPENSPKVLAHGA
jgi:hypothetical protein